MNFFNETPIEQLQSSNDLIFMSNGAKYVFDTERINKSLYKKISELIRIRGSSLQMDLKEIQQLMESQQSSKEFKNFLQSNSPQRDYPIFIFLNLIKQVNWEQIKGQQVPILNLSQVVYPIYSNLKNLKLASNRISNLEGIAFLNAPLLQQVDLMGNEISCLNGLQKALMINLRTLKIMNNKIGVKDFGRIKISQSPFELQQDLCSNVLKCAKLESKSLSNIHSHFNGAWLISISSPFNSLQLAQSKNVHRILKLPWSYNF